MNNEITIHKPAGCYDYSHLRKVIGEQLELMRFGELNPCRYETLFPLLSDYYYERGRNAELAAYERKTGERAEAEPMGSIFGNPAAYEYVCAVEDARWSGLTSPAWHDRECYRHNGVFYGRKLPAHGLVSLANLIDNSNANICCPHIFKVRAGAYGEPEYFDFEERACFYGFYYANADAAAFFDVWYTDNKMLIAQMHEFIENLSECVLDVDSMIF